MSINTLKALKPGLTAYYQFKNFIISNTEFHWAHNGLNCRIEGKPLIPWYKTTITLKGYVDDWKEVIQPLKQLDKDINLYLHALW